MPDVWMNATFLGAPCTPAKKKAISHCDNTAKNNNQPNFASNLGASFPVAPRMKKNENNNQTTEKTYSQHYSITARKKQSTYMPDVPMPDIHLHVWPGAVVTVIS